MGEETTPMYESKVTNNGIDPLLLAALGGNNNGNGMFGGNGNNSMWPLLFLFGRGMGTWGGEGYGGGGGAGGFAARTLASEATMTAKDVTAQLGHFQHWATENSALLQQAINGIDKSICCSTRDIMQSVNALTPQMFQSFSTLTQGMNSGFAGQQLACCQSTAAIQHALSEGFAAASRQGCLETHQLGTQMAAGFSASALAAQKDTLETAWKIDQGIHRVETAQQKIYNDLQGQADRIALQGSLQRQAETNALNIQLLTNANAAAMAACDMKNTMLQCCCEMKGVVTEDGQKTRSLINDNEVNNLRSKLLDTKELLSNANQTIGISQQLKDAVNTIVHHIPQTVGPAPASVVYK